MYLPVELQDKVVIKKAPVKVYIKRNFGEELNIGGFLIQLEQGIVVLGTQV